MNKYYSEMLLPGICLPSKHKAKLQNIATIKAYE